MATKEGKKTGGRSKGTPNKDNRATKEKFQQLLDGYSIQEMIKDLKSLEPKERLQIISGLGEYILPKLARQEVKHEGEVKIPTIDMSKWK